VNRFKSLVSGIYWSKARYPSVFRHSQSIMRTLFTAVVGGLPPADADYMQTSRNQFGYSKNARQLVRSDSSIG
jgi:hypothetical protein